MTVIKQDDLIQSVADALQFISYYHPVDFIRFLGLFRFNLRYVHTGIENGELFIRLRGP